MCIANKQMHDMHKDQLLFPPSKVIKMLKGQKKHIDKEQGKTKHEAPRGANYRARQNKNNIGTTALERSVVYTIGRRGVKGLSLYKLHAGFRYNQFCRLANITLCLICHRKSFRQIILYLNNDFHLFSYQISNRDIESVTHLYLNSEKNPFLFSSKFGRD